MDFNITYRLRNGLFIVKTRDEKYRIYDRICGMSKRTFKSEFSAKNYYNNIINGGR